MSTAKKRYSVLESGRNAFLRRARAVAKLTLPSLIPEEGTNSQTDYPTPYQSVGSRGVNNLAAKLLTSLFPPNEPFFRLTVDDFDLPKIAEDPKARGKVEQALAAIERSALMEVEARAFRVPMYEALRHLIIAGNVLLFQPPNTGSIKVYPLTRYVVSRDPLGNVLEIIIKETVSAATLTEDLISYLGIKVDEHEDLASKEVDRYTRISLKEGKYELHQEMNDKILPNSSTSYKKDEMPFLPLRFIRVESEDYGRGYVEEYFGDLKSLEALTEAIVEAAAASARILFLVNPNSTIDLEELESVPNLGFAQGREEDITTLKVDKAADMGPALQMSERLETRLSRSFMLSSSVQRAGERVTAEEIRYMAQELENALGGIYSLLSQELQLPVVRQLIREMQIEGKIPNFPEGVLKPQIVTGMQAIGRDMDLSKLERFIQSISQVGDVAYEHINWPDVIDRIAAGSGLDTEGLIKTQEQLQAEQQAKQAQMMQEQGMEMLKAGTPALAKGMVEQAM